MASKNIKGITIDIGGNTAPLSKALKGINSTSRNLQSELKEVNKLLKLDPKNTELLTQKQKLLSEAINNSKDKLDTLKEAEKQVQQQFQNGEVSEEQYRALKREIINATEELKALEKAAEQSNGTLDKVAEVAGKIGEKSEEIGKKMLPVSAGITVIGAASVASFNELDAGYDTIVTKTGATGNALEGLQNSMNSVFGELPTTAENAGIAIGEVNTRFGATGKTLETLSKQFIEFAEINETDLNNSIGMTNKIIKAWNIDAEKTPSVLGLITVKAQETGISVDTLMNSVLENNATFKEMGLTFEQSIGLMAEFERNGVNSTVALAGLKKAVVNYAKDGLTMEEGLKRTIESIKNASNETDALAEAQEVFGTKGAVEMTNAIREGRLSVDDLCKSMDEYGTTVEDTFNATLDPPDKAAVALNNLKIAGADLGNTILSALAPAFDALVTKVHNFAQWFANLNDKAKMFIVATGGIVAAIGPALIIFGKMASGVSAAIKAIQTIKAAYASVKAVIASFNIVQAAQAAISKAVAAAQWLVNAALNANPIGIVIIAIGALVAAFVVLWNKCESFRNFFIGMWENIKTAFNSFITWIKSTFEDVSNAFKNAWNSIKTLAGTWGAFFSGVWEGIKSAFSSVGSWFADTFSNAWAAVKNVFAGWGSFFVGLWNNVKNTFSSLGTNIASAIGGAVKSGINGVISMIQNTINNAIGIINGAIKLINKIPGVTVGKVARVTLPHLAAKGAVLTKATPIIAGEDGAEAIMPLEKNTAWIDVLAHKINDAMYGKAKSPNSPAPAVTTNLGGLNFVIEKFENHTGRDLRELMGEAMEVAEEYIKRHGGAFV